MARYSYRCKSCGLYGEFNSSIAHRCQCGDTMRREWTFAGIKSSFKPHYNHSIGKHINTALEFSDELKRQSEIDSERTGTEHRYVPVDMADNPPTDHGMESIEQARHTRGETPPKKYFI